MSPHHDNSDKFPVFVFCFLFVNFLVKLLDQWTTVQVEIWLKGLNMPASVVSSFKDHAITGRVIMTGLTEDDLKEMGIIKMFRATLLRELQKILDVYEEGWMRHFSLLFLKILRELFNFENLSMFFHECLSISFLIDSSSNLFFATCNATSSNVTIIIIHYTPKTSLSIFIVGIAIGVAYR